MLEHRKICLGLTVLLTSRFVFQMQKKTQYVKYFIRVICKPLVFFIA